MTSRAWISASRSGLQSRSRMRAWCARTLACSGANMLESPSHQLVLCLAAAAKSLGFCWFRRISKFCNVWCARILACTGPNMLESPSHQLVICLVASARSPGWHCSGSGSSSEACTLDHTFHPCCYPGRPPVLGRLSSTSTWHN